MSYDIFFKQDQKKKKRNQREERHVSLLLRRKKGKRGTQAYTTLTHMHRGRRLECDETSTGIVAKFRGRNFEQHRSSAINCTADERSFLEEIYELSLRIEFFLFKRMQRMISSIRHECSTANERTKISERKFSRWTKNRKGEGKIRETDWFPLEPYSRAFQMANYYFIMGRIRDYFCAGVGEPQETIIKPEAVVFFSEWDAIYNTVVCPAVSNCIRSKDLRICI